jgi:TolA-binding protein
LNRRFIAAMAALLLGTGRVAHAEEAPVPEKHQESAQVQSTAPDAQNEASAQSPAPPFAEPPLQNKGQASTDNEPSLADLKREIVRLKAAQRLQEKQLERQEAQIRELTTELLNTARIMNKLAKRLVNEPEPTVSDENVPASPDLGNKAPASTSLECGKEEPAVVSSPPPNV